MAVRLLFPTFLFHRNFHQENLGERGYSKEYSIMLRDEMDAMRRRDPVGRQLSNQYTGWQSNDGCESNPTFQKCMNRIHQFFQDEVLPFHGLDPTNVNITVSNSWANINDKGAWNAPHLHNGCWYSGVLYIKADGDEGDFIAIDTAPKVVADFPHNPRDRQNWNLQPTTGTLFLFPSALMHMVEPNSTNKDRYSISFNMNVKYLNHSPEGRHGSPQGFHPDELCFEVDNNGKLIHKLST